MKTVKLLIAILSGLILLGATVFAMILFQPVVDRYFADAQPSCEYDFTLEERDGIVQELKGGHYLILSSDRQIVVPERKGSVRLGTVGEAYLYAFDLDDIFRLKDFIDLKNRRINFQAVKDIPGNVKGITYETIKIKKAKEQIITTDKEIYGATYGGKPFQIYAETNADEGNKLTFSCKQNNVIKVRKNGRVVIRGAGKAKVIITGNESTHFYKGKKVVDVRIEKKKHVIWLSKDEYSVKVTAKSKLIKASADDDLKLKFKVEDKDIATIDKKGRLYPMRTGETNVIVSVKGDRNHEPEKRTVKVTVREVSVEEHVKAAIRWAKEIAADDSFVYGTGEPAHRNGCYFCGTNQWIKPKGYEKTYCCNPFIFAAYAHGAKDPAMLSHCQAGGSAGMKPTAWTRFGCFEYLGPCRQVPFSELHPGDVIMSDIRYNFWRNHVWMYIGNDMYVESQGEGWNAGTIAVKYGAKKYYSTYQSHDYCNVVYYKGR